MEYRTQSEHRLTDQEMTQAVKRAMEGDQDSFRILYEDTCHDKYFIALKYMQNAEDAADVVQDAYLKAWQSLQTLDDPSKFSAWLSRIVSHTAINALQKKKPLLFSQMQASDESDADGFTYEEADFRREHQPEHAYTDAETSALLKEMIGTLSDEQRMCVLMYYIEEQSVKEIAEQAHVSENTIKSRLFKGRQQLKSKADELEKKGYKLYGLTAVPFLRHLFFSESGTPEAQKAAASAMQKHTAKILKAASATRKTVTGSAAAFTGSATATGVKAAAIVIGIAALTGGGLYAANRFTSGTGDAPDDRAVQASLDALDEEARARFDTLLASLEEGMDPQWIYFDGDDYPDLIIADMRTAEEDRAGTYSLYDGETGEPYLLVMEARGEQPLYGMLGYIEGGHYYVPGEGILMDEHFQNEGEMVTMVFEKTETGVLTFRYVLACARFQRDLTGEEPVRVDMPEGTYVYMMYDENLETRVLTEEEYRELHHYGECKYLFGESGWIDDPPEF